MYSSMSCDEFYQEYKRKKVSAILDVRELDEFAAGHIPNAKHLPLSLLMEKVQDLAIEPTYAVICHSGARSNMACQILASQGYQVINVLGGMSAWKGEIVQ